MFSSFMTNAWIVSSIVAVIAGVIGFFVVLRGSAFAAHAIPNGAFAGAAAANLIGINELVGLGLFAVLAALGIGTISKRGRHDVATALALVTMLALGAVFLSRSNEYEPQIYALLFGEVLGVGTNELLPVAILAVASVSAVVVLYRPLMLTSLVPEIGEARGVSTSRMEIAFLVVLGLATAMTVPVVGALLIFSLMIGPPAAARSFTDRPQLAIVLSICMALGTVWGGIALSYETNWPIGFFVGTIERALLRNGKDLGVQAQASGHHRGRSGLNDKTVGLVRREHGAPARCLSRSSPKTDNALRTTRTAPSGMPARSSALDDAEAHENSPARGARRSPRRPHVRDRRPRRAARRRKARTVPRSGSPCNARSEQSRPGRRPYRRSPPGPPGPPTPRFGQAQPVSTGSRGAPGRPSCRRSRRPGPQPETRSAWPAARSRRSGFRRAPRRRRGARRFPTR